VTSLKFRLGLGLILSMLVMFALLWFGLGSSVRQLMEQQLVTRLQHDAENLLGGVRFDRQGNFKLLEQRIQGIYQQPFSGHYFIVEMAGIQLHSRSLWDESLPLLQVAAGESAQQRISGPQQQPLLLWVKGYRKGGKLIRIAVAEDMTALENAIHDFQNRLLLWLLAVILLLLLIQRYIVRRSLRSVIAAADEVNRLEHAEITVLDESVPEEVRPLVLAINKLLQRQQQRLQRSREALGNLAHAIKTPLTLLQQLAEEKLADADDESRRQLSRYSRQINQMVDQSLRRARLAGDSLGAGRFDLRRDLPALLDTLTRLYQDKAVTLQQQVDQTVQLPFEQQDGMELLGNLLDNAWKWANSTVAFSVRADAEGISISVEDDGPGVDEAMLSEIVKRGVRRDEEIPGHGIGLSVIKSLVEELDGEIEFGRAATLGGFKVEIKFRKG